MTFKIENKGGRWLVNDKPYQELNFSEKQFLEEFFKSIR